MGTTAQTSTNRESSVTKAEPFVKWAGGKSKLLGQLRKYLPPTYRRYFEPFVGGGALFFHLAPAEGIISDANLELINAYRVVRNNVDELIASLSELQEKKLTERLYYTIKKQDTSDMSDVQRATRFIFLNKTCYNGLWRVNKDGVFNVPIGKYKRMPTLYDPENLRAVSDLLKKTAVEAGYYNVVLEQHGAGEGDFVYLDPPYAPEENGNGFTNYTREVFNWPEQERLAKEFRRLADRGCYVMLSNSDTKDVRNLYSDIAEKPIPLLTDRVISCNGKKRTGFRELIILSYPPPSRTLREWMSGES